MVAQTRKIKADCGVEPGASSPPPAIAQAELYRATPMPALPPMPSMSSPKVTSTLVNTDVLAQGLKEFAGRDLAPYVLQVVLEGEARAGRDQRGFVVVGESAPTSCRSRTAPWWCRAKGLVRRHNSVRNLSLKRPAGCGESLETAGFGHPGPHREL